MSYNFDGQTTRFLSSSSPNINAYPSTISLWINLGNQINSNQILSWHIWTSSSNLSMIRVSVLTGAARQITLVNSSTLYAAQSTTTLSANTWHHICAVLLNTTSRTVYLDAGGSGSNTTSLSPIGMNTIRIGNSIAPGTGANTGTTLGRVSDVALWSTDLNADEIRSLSKGFSAKKIRPQSLEYYVPLTRDLIDYSGQLTITNNGSTPVSDNQRIYA